MPIDSVLDCQRLITVDAWLVMGSSAVRVFLPPNFAVCWKKRLPGEQACKLVCSMRKRVLRTLRAGFWPIQTNI